MPPSQTEFGGVRFLSFDELEERKSPTRNVQEPYRVFGVPGSQSEVKFAALHQVTTHGDISARHKHGFDQIRLVITGGIHLGDNIVARAGDVVYFPEQVMYGPTTYDDGQVFLLQWPGPSRDSYYLQYEEIKKGIDEMGRQGGAISIADGGLWRYPDGSTVDIWEALGRHLFGSKVSKENPRYTDVIVFRSGAFEALPVPNADGVMVKNLACLNAFGPNLNIFEFGGASSLEGGPVDSQSIWTCFEGEVEYEGKILSARSILYFPPGTIRSKMTSCNGAKLFVVQLRNRNIGPFWPASI